jgi:4-amino-4-deoxy-L-arabinose transferase-like glycosyltransferase
MKQYMRLYWPECVLVAFTLFFAFRELGTFPSAWLDDSLFMIVAKNVAEGKGYILPVLTEQWKYSYVLGVGPTVIFPAAIAIKLFGFSILIARIPFAILTCITSLIVYRYTLRISDRTAARLATGLLISFSAFVNTGKPVLGEIPAFFFLLLAIVVLHSAKSTWQYGVAGALLGLSVISKITFGIIYPALGVVGILILCMRKWKEFRQWFVVGGVALVTFGLWRVFEMTSAPGAFMEILQYGLAEGGSETFQVLRSQPELLLRFPYLYFGCLLILSTIGLWRVRTRIGVPTMVFIMSFSALFVVYFLNGPGWYRHLLPAHLLLIPFVFMGAEKVFSRKVAVAVMLFFIAAQGWWQWDHRGSIGIQEAEIAAVTLLEGYANIPMVIQQPEIYVRLPHAEHRLFLTEEMSKRNFIIFGDLPILQEEYCLPLVKKIGTSERPAFGDRIHDIHKRYVLIDPPKGCVSTLLK